jgi:branched-chain amino acid transport system ATP-binding protein
VAGSAAGRSLGVIDKDATRPSVHPRAAELESLFPSQPRLYSGDAIEINSLSVAFGGINAINQLSVSIAPHELAAVLGPNGSGKTTLLNALSGLNRSGQAAGHIRLLGQTTRDMRPDKICCLGVGRSFQDPHLLNNHSVIENVLLGAHRQLGYGIGTQVFAPLRSKRCERQWRDRAYSLLAFAGIAGYADALTGELSYGVRKLVDMLRAMVALPQVLLLDEPASGLDAEERRKLATLLADIRSTQNVTVVMIEHDLDLVASVASSVVAMQAGGLLIAGEATAVLASQTLRDALLPASAEERKKPEMRG